MNNENNAVGTTGTRILSRDTAIRQALARGPLSAQDLRARLRTTSGTLSRDLERLGPVVIRMPMPMPMPRRQVAHAPRQLHYALVRNTPDAPVAGAQPVFRVDEDGRASQLGTVCFLAGGGTWVDLGEDSRRFHEGLPPTMAFAAPSGYLGARIASVAGPVLGVPASLRDWSQDHCARFLCRAGADVAGSLVWGEASLSALMAMRATPPVAARDIAATYVALASAAAHSGGISSAGGQQPKFTCCTEPRGHVIVKFARAPSRSSDLLVLEELALRVLAAAGQSAARAGYFEHDGYGFLEVERFDRVGRFGRRGMISAGALDDEWFGQRDDWRAFAQRCEDRGWLATAETGRVAVLSAFSELIGNEDRHFENLSLLTDALGHGQPVAVAPAYDVLPTIYAPIGAGIEPALRPVSPSLSALASLRLRGSDWQRASGAAASFWRAAAADERLSAPMRETSADNAARLRRHPPPPLAPDRDPATEAMGHAYAHAREGEGEDEDGRKGDADLDRGSGPPACSPR